MKILDKIAYIWYAFLIVCVRKWFSPLMFWFVKHHFVYQKGVWNLYKTLGLENFNCVMKQKVYRPDPIFGILDFTVTDLDMFLDKNCPYRDCDDFANAWYQYAVENNYSAWLIYIVDGFNISTGHVFTVIKKDKKYLLCNFSIYGEFDNLSECIEVFRKYDIQKSGSYEKLIAFLDKENLTEN